MSLIIYSYDKVKTIVLFFLDPNAPTDIQLVKRTGLAITIRWPHVCSHCNYSIYAIPLNQKLRTIETSSECEFSLDRHCEFSFSVVPEELYTVVVKSISWGVESINGAELHNVSSKLLVF